MASRILRFSAILLGLFAANLAAATCTDSDGDGYFVEEDCGASRDCNDGSSSTHPGAAELCDGYDSDCDGFVDDAPGCGSACTAPAAGAATLVTRETSQ